MGQVYNPVKRTSTEKVSSNNTLPELIQRGLISSKIATAYTFLPCDIPSPKDVIITPVNHANDANGVALFTTQVGWQVDSLDTLSAVTDLDAFAQGVAYIVGNLVKATPTGGVEAAYVCLVANTSTTGGVLGADFAIDLALGYWLKIPTTTFLKITHTSAGGSYNAHFAYTIFGQ